jgi:hypothetical protein
MQFHHWRAQAWAASIDVGLDKQRYANARIVQARQRAEVLTAHHVGPPRWCVLALARCTPMRFMAQRDCSISSVIAISKFNGGIFRHKRVMSSSVMAAIFAGAR